MADKNTGLTVRCCLCKCLTCGEDDQIHLDVDHFPEPEQSFPAFCKICGEETLHRRVATRRLIAEQNRQKQEHALRQEILKMCSEKDFSCRFLYKSVIITTPLADWAFDYHLPKKTLYHESTVKINFTTGDYAKAHVQFRDKKMTVSEVIEYIAAHDAAKQRTKKDAANGTI